MTPWLLPLSIAVGLLAGILLLPSISDLASLCVIALGRGRRSETRTAGKPPWRLLFMVPAHDEELLIGRCVESLQALDYRDDRYSVLVVADNCTDRTAEIARHAGAECLERRVPDLRGKPHAIVWALERCDLDAYDALIIVDGDTIVDAGYGAAMTSVVGLPEKAVQAYNGVSNPEQNALTRMSRVLSDSYYGFAHPLKQRAGLNPPLTGAGSCIGTAVLARHGWPATSLSEDVEMWVRLTIEGVRTQCVSQARVFSQEAASLDASSSQRQRWRAGRLTILGRLGTSILRTRRVTARQKLDLFADLLGPGPAVHLGLVAILAPVALATPIPGGGWLGMALLASLVRPGVYTSLAIVTGPRPMRTLRSFLYLPFYTGWRLATELLAFGSVGDKPWTRTRRQGVASSGDPLDSD